MRTLLYGAALALSVGFAALAQPPESQSAPPPTAGAPAGTDVNATASSFRTGMIIKDSAGDTVGRIVSVGRGSDGSAAVSVNVDGKTVKVAGSTLNPGSNANELVSSMTKAQIKAAAPSAGW